MVNEKIIAAITNFVKAGDNSDPELLERVLHREFRVASNNFMGNPGVRIISRDTYVSNVITGVFGGLPRKMEILSVDQNGTIAEVKIRLQSAENDFISYNSFVLDTDGEWKLIHNTAVVEARN